MNNVKKTFGSLAVASLIAFMPLAASANTVQASGSTGIVVSPSGIVRAIGADVTAVGNGVVDAVLHIGNAVLNVALDISGNTKIAAQGSKSATMTDIAVGDKIAFKGSLASSTAAGITVAASKVRDLTNFPVPHLVFGTVSSVNTTNNTFVVANGSTTTTVATNASTAISMQGSNSALASIPVGSKVTVVGTTQADGSVLASRVFVLGPQLIQTIFQKDNHDQNNNSGNDKTDNNGNKSNQNGGSDDHGNGGLNLGLHLFGGLHFGKGN